MRKFCCVAIFGLIALPCHGQDALLYDDALGPGVENWSWAEVDLGHTVTVSSGASSAAVEPDDYEALYFHLSTPRDVAQTIAVRFDLHGGAGGQSLSLGIIDSRLTESLIGSVDIAAYLPGSGPENRWLSVEIPLADAGITSGELDGIWIQGNLDGDQPTIYVDNVVLVAGDNSPPTESIVVSLDITSDRRVIDDRIYGVNFGTQAAATDLGYPLRRWGGNATTRYNWQTDTSQRGFDYFFQSIVEPVDDESILPLGSAPDRFMIENRDLGLESILTVPMLGWTASDVREKRWSFSVAKYGPQDLDECSFYEPNPPFWCTADSGNGRCATVVNNTGFCEDGVIVGNDPTDASTAIGLDFITEWITHLDENVNDTSVRHYALDNEPMLWHDTHRDVRKDPTTYDELWSKTVEAAAAIKAQDPQAKIFGPAVWGWCAYFDSAADGCAAGPDRAAHDGKPFVEWYLEQVCTYEQTNGVRLVDYLDLHYYPQGDVSGLGGASDSEAPADQARRLRSVRELWDREHVAESWINQPVYLIPRMREWVDNNCPGIDLALTEYRWGTDDGASSALAQVDVLGIFGQQGLNVATRWVAPEPGSRVEDAFRLYLNYDGAGNSLSGTSFNATSDDYDRVSAYGIDSGQERFVVLVNKSTSSQQTTLNFAQPASGRFAQYRLDPSSGYASTGFVTGSPTQVEIVLPPRTASLLVERPALTDLIFDSGFE